VPPREDLFLAKVWQESRECRSAGGLNDDTTEIKQDDLARSLHANA
jgi:hypothetical protein